MQILTLIFSMFLGFLGGYFAARIAVDQAMHDRKKLDKELTSSVVENERDIIGLDNRMDQLEDMVLNQDDARTTDGENLNKNFEAIKDFMKQQHAINAQVNQALYVLTSSNQAVALYSDDEVLAVSEPEVKEQKVIDSIKEIMDQYSEEEESKEEQICKAKELATNSVLGMTMAKWDKSTDDPREEEE